MAIVFKGRAENDPQASLGVENILVPVVAILDQSYNLIGTFVERPTVVLKDTTGQACRALQGRRPMDDTLQDLLDVMEQHERNRDTDVN